MHSRKTFFGILLVFLLFVVLACVVYDWIYVPSHDPYSIDFSSVENIYISKMNKDGDFIETEMPHESFASILKLLQSASPTYVYMKWQIFVDVRIEKKGGVGEWLTIYETPDSEIVFSSDRYYYRGGSKASLLELLQKSGVVIAPSVTTEGGE